jgi:hypothetical protein
MSKTKPTFEVDKKGLAKLLTRHGMEFVVLELVQNALDEKSTKIYVTLTSLGYGSYSLSVTDDNPEGFKNLSHAYTLFAESVKAKNPKQRGRFNLGEKLVIAACKNATIETTTGTIIFTEKGRTHSNKKTPVGSTFRGELRLSSDDLVNIENAIDKILVPEKVELIYNEMPIPSRTPCKVFQATLPTEQADDEGYIRRTKRATDVEIYENSTANPSSLYEMGIPVVEIECPWHINILQKVPLNTERDNVTPAYLRELLAHVLNAMKSEMSKEAARAPWVDDVLETDIVTPEAISTILTARYGEKRVIADPSDPEGTKLAVSKGYQVIQAGSFNKAQWENIKDAKAALPAGQVTPSPKPWSDDPDARAAQFIPRSEWTPGMRKVADYAEHLAIRLLNVPSLPVGMTRDGEFSACYGPRSGLVFNIKRLGKAWFDRVEEAELDALLIHEFGHHFSLDHLSEEYYKALCKLGANLKRLALEKKLYRLEELLS